MKTILALMCIAAVATAAPVPKEVRKQTDAEHFVGTWWATRFNEEIYTDQASPKRFDFVKDGSAGIWVNARQRSYDYSFAVDQTTNPPTFTWIPRGERGGDGPYIASYRLDGDTLAVVFTATFCDANKALPKEVKPGAGDFYYELKRVK